MAKVDSTREGLQQGGDIFKSVGNEAINGNAPTSKPSQQKPGKMSTNPSAGGSSQRGAQG